MHFYIFIWGWSIPLFSFLKKINFPVSKGLLCLYNKQNNTWLPVDMEFLFLCSINVSLVCCALSQDMEVDMEFLFLCSINVSLVCCALSQDMEVDMEFLFLCSINVSLVCCALLYLL